jgi:AraC-like DNA-binding protein
MQALEQIRQMCTDIYDITGIKAVFYDGDMGMIYSHPNSMGAFCNCVRENPGLTEKCLACDREGFSQCRKTEEMVIYRCHMGLTEVVCPVKDNGAVAGYILFGQILSQGQKGTIQKRIETGSYQNKAHLLVLLEEMIPTEDTVIHACARLMTMCAGNIPLKDFLRLRRRSLPNQLESFIRQNLSYGELSITMLCRQFGISRGTLYTVSKEAFGMGVTEYIRQLRVQRAIELLRREHWPIYRIADEVGFADPNYLAKVIKAETGMTPKKIQKKDL